jgi:hypothetical protein
MKARNYITVDDRRFAAPAIKPEEDRPQMAVRALVARLRRGGRVDADCRPDNPKFQDIMNSNA